MKVALIGIISFFIFLAGNIGSTEENQDIVRAKIGIKLYLKDKARPAKTRDRVKTDDWFRIYVQPESNPAYIYVVHNDQNQVTLLNNRELIKTSGNGLLKLPGERLSYSFDGKSSREFITIICSPVELPKVEQIFNQQDLSHAKWLEYEQRLVEESQIDLSNAVPKPWTIGGAARGAVLKLIEESLENLRNEGLPDAISQELQPLIDQQFTMESEFLRAVEEQIGKDHASRYKELLLKHAQGKKIFIAGEALFVPDESFMNRGLKIFSGKTLVIKKYEFRVKK